MNAKQPSKWYHVTHHDLGDVVFLKPHRVYNGDEPTRCRLCVAPTIHQCLGAIALSYNTTYHVYEIIGTPSKAYRVPDIGLTEEHWFFGKREARRIMQIKIPLTDEPINQSRGDDDISSLINQYIDIVNLEQYYWGM